MIHRRLAFGHYAAMHRRSLDVPTTWPESVCSAILHACSLAHFVMVRTRSWCADSPLLRVKQRGELEAARNEIQLLKEEMRIKDSRMEAIPVKRRPFYPPQERLAILQLKAIKGWNISQTAKAFMLDPETISAWMKRKDDSALVNTPTPVNKYPPFVVYMTRMLKSTHPILGKKRIANLIAKAGLGLSASSVQRFIKARSSPKRPSELSKKPFAFSPHVTAYYPNHVWHLDLTAVPTSAGFYSSWPPFSLIQSWPFCWWVLVVMNQFTRQCIGFALFSRSPSSSAVQDALETAISRNGSPKYIISDKGPQFWPPKKSTITEASGHGYHKWCRTHKITPRFGAIGKHGSIALVERFIKSTKDECSRRILVPLSSTDMRDELACFCTWYNDYRPHEALDGRTPAEAAKEFFTADTLPGNAAPVRRNVHNSQLPEMSLQISRYHGRKHLPIVRLEPAC